MKAIALSVAVAAAVFIPVSSFAQQQSSGLTRAQVVAEQAELQRAGYYPTDWIHYPENLQAAQRKVAEQHARGTATQAP